MHRTRRFTSVKHIHIEMLPLLTVFGLSLLGLAAGQVRTSFASPYASYSTEVNAFGENHYNSRNYLYPHYSQYSRYGTYRVPSVRRSYDVYGRQYGNGDYGRGVYHDPLGYRKDFYRQHYAPHSYYAYNDRVRNRRFDVVAATPASVIGRSSPSFQTSLRSSAGLSREFREPPPTSSSPSLSSPSPYHFGYSVDGVDGFQQRRESADVSGRVNGEYSFVLPDGRQRRVEYTADEGGFRAKVNTNEPGTESQHPAAVRIYSSAAAGPLAGRYAAVPVYNQHQLVY